MASKTEVKFFTNFALIKLTPGRFAEWLEASAKPVTAVRPEL